MEWKRGTLTRIAVALCALVSAAAAAEPPRRVVSMNLCTDQLALLIGAPGQVVSVSDWAAKPSASNMVEAAAALPANGASAEQVFLMKPDLVLAGTFTNRVAVDMLRRLGLRVEQLSPARSVDGVKAAIREMGALLGRDARAEAVVAAFEAALAAEAERAASLGREEAAYHYANNYTSGADTLAAEAMDHAGFDNAAEALGLTGAARLPLEIFVMRRPFVIRTETLSGAETGRAYETRSHPALAALGSDGRSAVVPERWQICGTPFIRRTVAALIDARLAAQASTGAE